MTHEQFEKAVKYIEVINRSKERLSLIERYEPNKDWDSNRHKEVHKVVLKRKPEAGSGNSDFYFYFEVMNFEMIKYLVEQEKNLLRARITKFEILLSKL